MVRRILEHNSKTHGKLTMSQYRKRQDFEVFYIMNNMYVPTEQYKLSRKTTDCPVPYQVYGKLGSFSSQKRNSEKSAKKFMTN